MIFLLELSKVLCKLLVGLKPAYRIRPRYNSEYVWNLASLKTIGGDATDYHTKPLWITQP